MSRGGRTRATPSAGDVAASPSLSFTHRRRALEGGVRASRPGGVRGLRGLAQGDAVVRAPSADLKNGAYVKAG